MHEEVLKNYDETGRKRLKLYESLAEELRSLEGVDNAELDDWAGGSAYHGYIFVFVDAESFRDRFGSYTFKINVNLRSLVPRMKKVLDESDARGYTFFERPKTRWDSRGRDLYKDKTYMIRVSG